MGMTAALKLETIVDQLETVLACEILASCQAMEYRRPLKPGVGTGRAYALVREVVPPLTADRPSGPDIGAVRQLIRRQSLNRCLPGAREAG